MVSLRSGRAIEVNGRKEMANGSHKNHAADKNKLTHSSSNVQLIAFISLIFDLLGFTVILPLFPALLEYYSKNDSSGLYSLLQGTLKSYQSMIHVPIEFNAVLFGGFLGSLFSMLQFVSSPFTGAMSDVYGRKPVYMVTLVGSCLSYLIWAISSNFAMFVIFRIVGGLFKGNISLAYSIMTDISDTQSRSKGMALIGIAFSIGFIVGPVVGVGFSKWGSTGWFAASATYAFGLSVLNLLFFAFFFEETLPKSKRIKSIGSGFKNALNYISPIRLFSFKAVKLPEQDRSDLNWLGLVYFLYLFIYSGLEFTLTFVTHYKHGFDSMAQGRMFAFLGIVMALVQGGYVRRIEAGNEKNTAKLGLSLMIPSFAIIGFSDTVSLLYFGLFLYAVGSSLFVPCLTAIASTMGPDSQKGVILGIWRSLGYLARACGPIVASIGFWLAGTAIAYATGGILLLVPLIMLHTFDSSRHIKRA